MRAVKILVWLVIVTVAMQLAGFIAMGLDGYDFYSEFFPREGTTADLGLLLTSIASGAYVVFVFATWIVLSLAVSRARDRIVGFQWMHGRGAIWGWWLVPVANYWMPRSVYLEIARNARPSDPGSVHPEINRWWGWYIGFAFATFIGIVPAGPVYYVVVTTAALLAGVISALALSSVLDLIDNPEETREGAISEPEGGWDQTTVSTSPTIPGWYYDPSGSATHQAYWDGGKWTGATRPDPRRFPDAMPPRPRTNRWVIVAIIIGVAVFATAVALVAIYLADQGFADALGVAGRSISSL